MRRNLKFCIITIITVIIITTIIVYIILHVIYRLQRDKIPSFTYSYVFVSNVKTGSCHFSL